MTREQRTLVLALIAALAASSCTSLQRNYDSALPTATPSDGGTPSAGATIAGATPSACATANPSATQVAMVSFITATPNPTYGTIDGYAIVTNGSAPVVAQTISVSAGTPVQFVNGEDPGTPTIYHSAVGFENVTGFPATPYAFPTVDASAIGTQIANVPWSTGRVAPNCYSQTFSTNATGTYYFGDYDYYNLSNTRDVIIVTGTSS